jgi:hypothetical protein
MSDPKVKGTETRPAVIPQRFLETVQVDVQDELETTSGSAIASEAKQSPKYNCRQRWRLLRPLRFALGFGSPAPRNDSPECLRFLDKLDGIKRRKSLSEGQTPNSVAVKLRSHLAGRDQQQSAGS